MGKATKTRDPLAKRSNETHSQWQQRIALAGLVRDDDKDRNKPNPFAMQHGDYKKQFVSNDENRSKAQTWRNRESTILEQWFKNGGIGFEEGARRAIMDCQALWARMGEPRLIAHYGERMAGSTHGDGYTQQEASDEMHFRRKMFPPAYWSVFEAVVRHNEPAGVAGSRLANNRPQQIAMAKAIVGMVASMMAARLGY